MKSAAYSLGFIFVAVFLMFQVSEARDLPSAGLLDEMPENCSGAGYCLEKHPDYPQDRIDRLLTKKYNLMVTSEHEPAVKRDGSAEENSDCESVISYGQIYEIVDEDNNTRVVVQSPKLFKQQIRIEQCLNPGPLRSADGTYNFSSKLLKIYNFSCFQKTIDYNFLVLTRDGEDVESVKSKHGIPVCCSCRLIDE